VLVYKLSDVPIKVDRRHLDFQLQILRYSWELVDNEPTLNTAVIHIRDGLEDSQAKASGLRRQGQRQLP